MADTELIDHTGRTVFRGTQKPPGGGSSPVKVIQKTIAFDAANILTTGAEIYVPAAGDWFVIGYPSVRTAWDGATPRATFCLQGHEAEYLNRADISFGDSAFGGGIIGQAANALAGGSAAPFWCVDATPLVVIVDDGSSGDPGSMQGSMEVFLLVAPVAA